MKASKKFLSMLLVLTMVFSFAAVSASAEGFMIFSGSNSADSAPSAEPVQSPAVGDAEQDATIIGSNDNDAVEGTTEEKTPEETAEPEEPEVTDPVAVIVGSKKTYKYVTLQEAIAAAAEGATVQLVKDITISEPLTISKNLTLSLAEATITFKGNADYDAALVVDSGAVVTIEEGELSFKVSAYKDGKEFGFVNGIFAEDGEVYLVNMTVGGAVNGGSKLVNAKDGSISVMYCELDFDPSAYVPEGFKVVELAGQFAVVDDDTPSTNEIKPNQEGDIVLTADGKTAEAGVETVDKDTTLNLNGKKLTGDITVASGVTLRIINAGALDSNGMAAAVAAATIDGKIVLDGGNLIIENNVTVTGEITMKADSGLVVKDKDVTVDGGLKLASGVTADKIDGLVTAGKFGNDKTNSEAVLNALMPKDKDGNATHEIGNDGRVSEKTPSVSTDPTVTDASGNSFNNTTNYLQYFKGKTELASEQSIVRLDSTVFHLSAKPDKVMIDKADVPASAYTWTDAGKTLTFNTEKTNADVGTGKSEVIVPAFNNVSAGAHNIVFVFADKTVEVPVYVWASIVTTDIKHVVGDKNDKTVEMSDKPVSVKVDDKEVKEDGNWSFKDGVFTIKASYLDSLTAGDKKISFAFDNSGSEFVSYLSIINVTPVDANKDNKWLNSSTALSYNVSHAVDGVKVDGTAVDPANYSVSDKNVLSLKASYLKTLKYGEHSLTITTGGVDVTIKFTTAPSLVPKDATNHTKGGSKDLVFIASDPMNAVYVGKTQLKSDYYTISSDGKTITLKAAFLNTLKADNTYNITAAKLNSDGKAEYSAATSFKILSAASAGATPSTGDTGLGLWVALLVISGAAIAVILPKRRKDN